MVNRQGKRTESFILFILTNTLIACASVILANFIQIKSIFRRIIIISKYHLMLKDWIQQKLRKANNQPLWRLFLLGLKGQLDQSKTKPYSFYPRVISAILSLCFAKWLTDFYRMQIDVKGYNWFVAEYVYKVREESHIYWELARLVNKLPTTFTYYKWGDGVMYEINRKGQQKPFLSHTGIQSIDTFQSFLHQYNFPASPERNAQIIMYLKNIKNPYNLQNYLRTKSINIGDWIRAFYYLIYRELGLTNRWRYDEFVSKPNIYYSWQKMKLAYFITRDRANLYKCLDEMEITKNDLVKYFIWIA